jgi:hypothetical protein
MLDFFFQPHDQSYHVFRGPDKLGTIFHGQDKFFHFLPSVQPQPLSMLMMDEIAVKLERLNNSK